MPELARHQSHQINPSTLIVTPDQPAAPPARRPRAVPVAIATAIATLIVAAIDVVTDSAALTPVLLALIALAGVQLLRILILLRRDTP